MILADKPAMSDFYFRDAIRHWIPMQGNHKFYNTRIPMTLVSYNTSGGRETAQDRLQADFSGNVNNNLRFFHLWAEKRKIIKLFGVWHIDKRPRFHLE